MRGTDRARTEICTLRSAVVSEKDSRIVVLDLSEVEALDAGGLNALLSLHQWAGAAECNSNW